MVCTPSLATQEAMLATRTAPCAGGSRGSAAANGRNAALAHQPVKLELECREPSWRENSL
jgi:hypothetical protein